MGNKQRVFGQQQIPSDETKSARGLSDPARSSKQYKSWIEVRLRCHCECLSCKQAGQLSFPHGVAKSDQGLDMGIEPHQATGNLSHMLIVHPSPSADFTAMIRNAMECHGMARPYCRNANLSKRFIELPCFRRFYILCFIA